MAAAQAQVERLPQLPRSAIRRRPAPGAARGGARRRLQHARRRSRSSTTGVREPLALLLRGARRLRARLAASAGPPAEVIALAEHARRRAPRRTSRVRRAARRIAEPAGRSATPPGGSSSFRRSDARAGLRPPAGARGAARPARGARAVGDRARVEDRAVARRRAPRVQVKPEREWRGGRDARPPGRARLVRAVPLRRRARARGGERPLLACLDQVTDPRNLGAVIRSAEGAGATGVVVPAHGAARVTAAVCRASAGAVEHLPVAVVPNLARYLNEIKRGDLWIYAASAEAEQDMWRPTSPAGSRSSSAPRARGCGRSSVGRVTRRSRSRSPATSSRSTSASRRRCSSTRRGGSARWLSRRSISSTVTTCSTRARSPTSAS